MDALEVECGSLADSLLQGQVIMMMIMGMLIILVVLMITFMVTMLMLPLQVTKAENEEGRLVAEEQLQVELHHHHHDKNNPC